MSGGFHMRSAGFHMKSATKDQQFARNGKAYDYYGNTFKVLILMLFNLNDVALNSLFL